MNRMCGYIRISLYVLCASALYTMNAGVWSAVKLDKKYQHPADLTANTYSMQFPTTPPSWYPEKDCYNWDRATSMRWINGEPLEQVAGFSFKGLVYTPGWGSDKNEFAIFFHEKRCYDGGGEYGWVFRENSHKSLFYLCADCNIANKQKWFQWPGDYAQVTGDVEQVKNALENSAQYRYWNIKLTPEGDFIIELIDPVSWQTYRCTIKRPDWFPNLYKKEGHITINAQKFEEKRVEPSSYMHVDEVKIWRD